MHLFLGEKQNKTCWIYIRTMYLQTGKIQSELKFYFDFVIDFSLLTQLLPFTWNFVEKGWWLVWDPVG